MSQAKPKKSIINAIAVALGGLIGGAGLLVAGANAADAPGVDREVARDLFHSYSCGACHSLADAGAGGSIGPTLDNPTMTREFIIDRVANGQGAMPAFGGQLSEEDIALLADYIVEVNHEAAE